MILVQRVFDQSYKIGVNCDITFFYQQNGNNIIKCDMWGEKIIIKEKKYIYWVEFLFSYIHKLFLLCNYIFALTKRKKKRSLLF